ncbi:PAS domain-containing sensor histidine kinase [uncultured Kiloniella sp.]|uniref:PAS domain-containing sensor histidine kinase n=1 Tax=uncultured Kiloniella sp. TaxID=1133091 RepID=UPI0026112B37|nr:PAS domain-containing sensor histidine kinase [uncultured Kiloniella sp.]
MTSSLTESLPEFHFWQDLSAFNRLSTAIWIFDIEDHNIWWGNESALKFWNADTLEDLVKRDFSTDSSSVRRRLHEMFETSARGDRVEENWTLYPNSQPQMAILTFTPILIESGRKALLIEATPQIKDELDHRTKRILEAVRHTPLMITTFDGDGSLLAQNPAAANAYNVQEKSTTIEDRYNDPEIRKRILDQHDTPKRFKRDIKVFTAFGERWHTLTAEIGLDPVSGRQVIVATEEDITERVKAQEELRRLNLNLEQRVAERTHKLTIARQEAESANKSKGNFLATMSHELRTPLNAIIGFSDMLGHQIYGPINEKQTAAIRDIHSSAQHLLELINELLDASTIDSGELKLFEEYFQHDDIVDYCHATFELEAMKKDQTLIVENKAKDILIKGDSRRFRQILINLLGNAFKYTPEGGTVSLLIDYDNDDNLLFQVQDTGIGIEETRLPDICKAFTQVASSSWAAGKGVGLGLYIASRLIDAHDGTLTITSKVNQGTNVKVLIPQNRLKRA